MSPHHRAPLVILLRPGLATAVQLEWAVFLAAAGRRDLLILQRVEDSEDRVEEVALDESGAGDTPVIVREVVQVIENSDRVPAGAREGDDAEADTVGEPHVVHVRLRRAHFSNMPALRLGQDLASRVRRVAADHYDHSVRIRLLTRIAIDVGAGAEAGGTEK